MNRLPDFVIVGAMKSATTSLHHYLSLHAQISLSNPKELNFFTDHWEKGVAWYSSHFTEQSHICGEASPNYSKCHLFEDVPRRMYQIMPKAKLIYIMRDPVDRMVSHYYFNCLCGLETRSLSEAFEVSPDNGYINTSKYYMQIEKFLTFYPLDQVFLISSEKLKCHPEPVLKDIFQFLGVIPEVHSPTVCPILNQSEKRKKRNWLGKQLYHSTVAQAVKDWLPPSSRDFFRQMTLSKNDINYPILPASLRQDLVDVLRPDVEELKALTGRAFSKWCV